MQSQSTPDNSASEAMLAARVAFLQISDEDCRRVRALAPAFQAVTRQFVERFYSHLLAEPATAGFLTNPELVERLKQKQKQYFDSLLKCELDGQYVDERRRVGLAHALIELEPQWFLGAYNQFIQYCFRYFSEHATANLDEYVESTLSLLKLILLDIGLTLDAYFARSTEQLSSALELLARSNAELKEFALLVTHDLKTPLGTVAALCEEFLDEFGEQVPAAGRELIEAARSQTMKTSHMVEDLLSMSEAVARPEQRRQIAIRTVLDEVLEQLRPEIEARNVRVVVPDRMPEVYVHPGRLREVFTNLVSNAVKFLDKQPGLVQISAERKRDQCILCVADNGPGIAESDRIKIFVPFQRLPQHRGHAGSGLGLHFVQTIVNEQGGEVWVESTVGEGSRFFVSLPAAKRS